jgi:hypothetical protein
MGLTKAQRPRELTLPPPTVTGPKKQSSWKTPPSANVRSAVRRGLFVGLIVVGVVLPAILSAYWFRVLTVAPGPQGPAESEQPQKLAFAAATDRTVYRTGHVAMVAIAVTNVGRGDVDLYFRTPCFWTFVVYDSHRETEFDYRSVVSICVLVIEQFVLSPGESREMTVRYHLVTTEGRPLPTDQHYEIVPSFWDYPEYQELVSRTDTARFYFEG